MKLNDAHLSQFGGQGYTPGAPDDAAADLNQIDIEEQRKIEEQFSKSKKSRRRGDSSREMIQPREERESSSERLLAKLGGTTKSKLK